MADYVTDTHALVWYLSRDRRLPSRVKAAFADADHDRGIVWIPGIVLVEVIFLAERAHLPEDLITQVLNLVDPPMDNYPILPLDAGVIRALQTIDRKIVPEMPDRLIAASARFKNLPLLSKDQNVAAVPGLTVIW